MSGNGFSTEDRQMEVHLQAMSHPQDFVLFQMSSMRETKEVAFCVGKLMSNKSLTKMKSSTQTAEHASSSFLSQQGYFK